MSAKLARVLPHTVMLVVACLLYWAATRIDSTESRYVSRRTRARNTVAVLTIWVPPQCCTTEL